MKRRYISVLLVLALLLVGALPAYAHPDQPSVVVDEAEETGPVHDEHQHGGDTGHLPASSRNVELVGKVNLTSIAGGISDVAAYGSFAYLGAFSSECVARGGNGTGVHVVDIKDPAKPKKVGFIPAHSNSYVGEGVHVFQSKTESFQGDILVHNNEPCNSGLPGGTGVSLWDVTDPTSPKPLALEVGDMNQRRFGTTVVTQANSSHSAQGWAVGDRAYVVMVDNQEFSDVDILDVTDPRNPRQIADVGILDWPGAHSPLANGDSIFHHDMQVREIDGHWYLLVSYWDAGFILLNIDDPAKPVFIDDYDYPMPDPLMPEFKIPEGNGHQATWSSNNKYILGSDEDFAPNRTAFQITTGPNAGPYGAGEFGWTVPLSQKFGNNLNGPTIWGGSGCEEDTDGNGVSDRAQVPPASGLTAGPGEAKIVVFTRGTCFFSKKVESGQMAGYDAVIVANSHAGARGGLVPDAFTCGSQGHSFTVTVSAVCVGHRAMHQLFNDTPAYSGAEGADLPAIGTVGEKVKASTVFDGWGYLHLIDAQTLDEVDSYAVAEGLDPKYASGYGNLTIHEVKTDPRRGVNLAYLSYYDAGLRVVKFGQNGIEEVGHYIGEGGNDFWGTFPLRQAQGRPLLLMSDRDSGLWIFRYTGQE